MGIFVGDEWQRDAPGNLAKVKDNFFCVVVKGHPLALSQEIYRQIESLHSFARPLGLLCGQKAIKVCTWCITRRVYGGCHQQPRRFYRTVYVHEAKMSGGIINTPCVNKKANMKLPFMG
jgi:DNA polymerase-3 subunit alpha/error-prone DNA polymerase